MIKIGTQLMLELKKENGLERFRCKVVEQEDNLIYVDYPINENSGRTGIFTTDTEFHARFVGQDHSIYLFATRILDKKVITIPTLVLEYPANELVRIQRREYVRITTSIDVAIDDPDQSIEPFTTISQDISGGGVSIFVQDKGQFIPRKLIDVWMVLPLESGSNEYVYATAEIIRVRSRKDKLNDILTLKFVEINDKDRQMIIKYCFERQLKGRRRLI
ncbi:flagellar brake protein [Aquibacillus salsiterrae]|uniref:Flagellar brake domain-containing protein n=1 Tax=Aquibacillus salsiterrae TaxID=2950439 RepID=A0A9X3WE47_9BACI|nr:flagellar brake domain-containing protein [Aquibacillus salsiterrae]MDC3415396.1 flagellar brake domain-containing protein [Aquibacillus salsiterrae]